MHHSWRLVSLLALSSLCAGAGVFACTGFRDSSATPPDGGEEAAGPDGGEGDAGSPFSLVQALPAGEALTAIWGADADDIFAVGSNGLHYDYYDSTWHRYQTEVGYDYQAVWGYSATDVYGVGVVSANNTGFIEHYDGTKWTLQELTPTALYGVWGTTDAVLAVGSQGMIYGQHPSEPGWTMVLGDAGLPANPNVASSPDEPILWGIAGSSLEDFAMPADLDRIFHAENALSTGDFVNLDPTVDRTISFRSVFAVPGSSGSYFFGSNYLGVVWLTPDGPPNVPLLDDGLYSIFEDHSQAGNEQLFVYGIWGAANHYVFTGDQGRIYTYAAGLDQFSTVVSPTDATLYGAWGSSASDVWIVGDRESILHGALP